MTVIIGLTPMPGREQRAVRDVEAADDAVVAGAGPDAARRVARMRRRIGAHPDRAHLVGREDRAAVRRGSRTPPARLERARTPRRSCPRRGTTPDGVPAHDDVARRRPPGPGAPSAERVAERRDPGGVEPVVEPDPAGRASGVVRPSPPSRVTAMSGAEVAGVGHQRRVGAAPSHGRASASRPGWPGADSMT